MAVPDIYIGRQFRLNAPALVWKRPGDAKRTQRVERAEAGETFVTFQAEDQIDVTALLRTRAISIVGAPRGRRAATTTAEPQTPPATEGG